MQGNGSRIKRREDEKINKCNTGNNTGTGRIGGIYNNNNSNSDWSIYGRGHRNNAGKKW